MKKALLLAVVLTAVSMISCRKEDSHAVRFEQDEITVNWTKQGDKHYIYLLDGNGEYTWSFDPEGIAEVKEVMYGTVTLLINSPGRTTLTLTDRLGTSDDLIINILVPADEDN